jgi:hypothetical protein
MAPPKGSGIDIGHSSAEPAECIMARGDHRAICCVPAGFGLHNLPLGRQPVTKE